MDKITKSLRKYLDSAGIPHQTLFNSKGGLGENSTSTCFHRISVNNLRQMAITVNIFPKDNEFYIIARPLAVLDDGNMDELLQCEAKWNRCAMMTSLVFEEERGVTMPNRYCFQLFLSAYCDSDGLGKTLWKKYLERIEDDTWHAWKNVDDILLDIDEETNESGACDVVPF